MAQCLHPALPSGVHLKALEVYTVLFQNIGLDNLSKDLFLYANGLFPLLANAALSVKPILISIYETYFIPLRQSLRPCLTGLILGILPGLEEGSDFYSRTFNLLKSICIAQSDITIDPAINLIEWAPAQIADDQHFYTCLWSAIVSQSAIRFPAIQFILANYENKKKTSTSLNDQILYLIGNSSDLMINAICCCLQDPNSLVQRSVLDFINLCLPIDTNQINNEDKLQLIVVAIHVVLRRDMSLNRRIYSWLMGSSSSSANSSNNTSNATTPVSSTPPQATKFEDFELKVQEHNFFNSYSKNLLVNGIKMLLNNKKDGGVYYLVNDELSSFYSSGGLMSSSGTTGSTQTGSAHASPSTAATLKILKIVSNLVERQEIGQAIIDDILLDLLFYVYRECCSLMVQGK